MVKATTQLQTEMKHLVNQTRVHIFGKNSYATSSFNKQSVLFEQVLKYSNN